MANEIKIYFYSTDININNYTTLKISFDEYLNHYKKYEFQPFSDKETFENQLKNKDSIVIISSWHYRKIKKEYNLDSLLVAQKNGSITDTKILVGRKDSHLEGLVSSAYDTSYTQTLLKELENTQKNTRPILIVPKEIDALMSVSFNMSDYALVSKDSFHLLKSINPALTKDLTILNESDPKYRILIANNKIKENKNNVVALFNNMSNKELGKNILEMMGIEKLVVLTSNNKISLGDI